MRCTQRNSTEVLGIVNSERVKVTDESDQKVIDINTEWG